MKAGAGKSKGSSFERWVAKALSLWLTGGADDKQLIRSVLSGGWKRGTQGDDPWRHAGDLAPNGPEGEAFRMIVAVECKHHRRIDLYGLWTKKTDLLQWWNKLREESQRAGVEPMLIFRANQRPVMVAMSTRLWGNLVKSSAFRLETTVGAVESTVASLHYAPWQMVMLPWESFRQHFLPADLS